MNEIKTKESAPAVTGTHKNTAYYNAQNNAGRKNDMLTRQESQAEIEAVILNKILTRSELEITPKLINFLDQEDFTLPFHRQLFRILKKLSRTDNEIDVYSVAQEMGMESPYVLNNLVDLATLDIFTFDSTVIDLAKKLKEKKLRKRISYLKLEEIKKEIEKIEEISKEEDDLTESDWPKLEEEDSFLLTILEDKDKKSGVLEHSSMLLTAIGGIGKSSFATQFACYMSIGEPLLFLRPHKKVKSLICNFEDKNGKKTYKTIKAVARLLKEKKNYDQEIILEHLRKNVMIANQKCKKILKNCFIKEYNNCSLNKDAISILLSFCRKKNIELLVVDPVICVLNTRDYAQTYMEFCEILNKHKINVLTISHLNKNTKLDTVDRIYGGVEMVNLNQFVVNIQRDSQNPGYYIFTIIKANDVSDRYQNKPYYAKKHDEYWQIFEEVETYSSDVKKNKRKKEKKKNRWQDVTEDDPALPF